ncbi:MAG: alpha/beta hydrolase [Elusimicrobia bacterium]|nr:alpha/beta hydrolase [Elusimicrobiota bacterium]
MSSILNARVPALLFWLVTLAALWLALRRFEQSSVYVPFRELSAHPGSIGLGYEELSLKTPDGETLHAWFIPAAHGSRAPVLLFCHGNGGNISHRLEKIKIFRAAGLSVLAFDYRGYGRSTGRPSELGTYEDAQTAYRWLIEQGRARAENIVLYGESLGAGVAVELARRLPSAGLIIDSGFTSIVDMGKHYFPWLPVRWLARYRYDNLSKIPGLSIPILVLHSPQDDIIPYPMGLRLFEAARAPKRFVELKGDHNEGFLQTGPAYGEAIGRFAREMAKG